MPCESNKMTKYSENIHHSQNVFQLSSRWFIVSRLLSNICFSVRLLIFKIKHTNLVTNLICVYAAKSLIFLMTNCTDNNYVIYCCVEPEGKDK